MIARKFFETPSELEAFAQDRIGAGLTYMRLSKPGRLSKRNAGTIVKVVGGLTGRVVGEERHEGDGLYFFRLVVEVRCADVLKVCRKLRGVP